jgi:hypothetical protein
LSGRRKKVYRSVAELQPDLGHGRYSELKRALKLIRAFVRSLARMRKESTASSVVLQLDMIREEFFNKSEEEPMFESSEFGGHAGGGGEAPESEGVEF